MANDSLHVSDSVAGDLRAAVARLKAAAMPDGPLAPMRPELARNLINLAAAIERIEAEVAAAEMTPADGLAAAERIEDIAFMLREREVGATLCDALEAAIRALGNAVARHHTAAERGHSVGAPASASPRAPDANAAAGDALAAVRALSEEELIALFS